MTMRSLVRLSDYCNRYYFFASKMQSHIRHSLFFELVLFLLLEKLKLDVSIIRRERCFLFTLFSHYLFEPSFSFLLANLDITKFPFLLAQAYIKTLSTITYPTQNQQYRCSSVVINLDLITGSPHIRLEYE